MVMLHLFDESQTRLADFGFVPECKSKIPRGLNEISLPLARIPEEYFEVFGSLHHLHTGNTESVSSTQFGYLY